MNPKQQYHKKTQAVNST